MLKDGILCFVAFLDVFSTQKWLTKKHKKIRTQIKLIKKTFWSFLNQLPLRWSTTKWFIRKREDWDDFHFRPSILTPCYWPLDIIHHFLNCFHCIHMSIFFKRSTLEFASRLHLPKYPVSIQKSPIILSNILYRRSI